MKQYSQAGLKVFSSDFTVNCQNADPNHVFTPLGNPSVENLFRATYMTLEHYKTICLFYITFTRFRNATTAFAAGSMEFPKSL